MSQVVGALVAAEQLASNDQLISDRILTLSNGFVQSYDMLGRNTLDGGLVEVRIRARVRRDDVNNILQREGVIKLAIDSRGLAAERRTKEMTFDDAMAMFEDLMEGCPGYLLDASMSSRPRFDMASNKVVFDIVLKLENDNYLMFVKKLIDIFPGLGIKHDKAINVKVYRDDADGFEIIKMKQDYKDSIKEKSIMIADRWPRLSRNKQEATVSFRRYIIPENTFCIFAPLSFAFAREAPPETAISPATPLANAHNLFGYANGQSQ